MCPSVCLSVCRTYRLTAKVINTMSLLTKVISVDYKSVGESVDWLIRNAQNGDGSFRELAVDSKKVVCGSLFTSHGPRLMCA